MVTNHNLIILFSVSIMKGLKSILHFITSKSINSLDMNVGKIVQTVALPDEYTFSHLTVDQETDLIAVCSEIDYQSDTIMVFALYQSDPYLQFQQLLEVCSKIITVTHFFLEVLYLINKLSFIVFRSRSQCLEIP